MKLTVVGGGSTYTPELVDGLVNPATRAGTGLQVEELVLVDTDPERLDVVGDFARRMARASGADTRIRTTTSLEEGAEGAQAVLVQLRVGGQRTRRSDETFPLECGCLGQETTGAGGLAKALRTVPVVLDIAERVRAVAGPDAWIVDFTNPVGIVTRSLLDAGHRAVGLCNVAVNAQRNAAGVLGVDPDDVELRHVGLNHLSWETAVTVGGVDRLPGLLADHAEQLSEVFRETPEHLRLQRALPSYYLRYFHAHDLVVAEQRQEPPRADVVSAVESELLEIYRDPTVTAKPEQLSRRGGRHYSLAALQLVAALLGAPHDPRLGRQVVNVRNRGTLPFLSDGAVIEAACTVTTDGPAPLPVGPVDPLLAGLIAHTSAYEELAVEAAVRGGRDRVLRALLAHPLVGQHHLAEQLTDRLLAANAPFLAWTR